ncbi:MAG: ATP-binding domain-containing protein, partial [Duncaniella sp.]|nr:ATP-binding domain-containing protein [Duncaniella sp.]
RGNPPLCVVGDDSQSIYSFRGANIRNILEMEQSFPGLKIFKLERNYRSTRNIIAAAGSLIAKNVDQIPKNVYSENSEGTLIDIVRCYSDFEEAALVAARVAALKHSGSSPWAETAILYRTNVQSRVLEESLRKRNVPYRIYGGLSFYQRKEVKDAVAYFRLALNPDDDEALRRVINFPARGIGETTMGKLITEAVNSGVSIWHVITDPDSHPDLSLNSGTRRKLSDFAALIAGFNDQNASGADAYSMARSIIDATGLYSMLLHDNTPETISRKENLEELLKGAREYVDTMIEQGSDELSLAQFMTEISLATDQDGSAGDGEDAITLMTVHSAKGLEFDNVFIVGVEEELFPSARASDSPSEIEEERRLLYVAITRARRYCMISYASQRFRNGQTLFTRPSRFISDIDPAYIHFSTGASSSTVPAADRYKNAAASAVSRYASRSMQDSRRSLNSLRETPRPTSPYAGTASNPRIVSEIPVRPSASQVSNRSADAVPAAPGTLSTHHSSELSVGMRIHHSKFGPGLIEGIDTASPDHRITVSF